MSEPMAECILIRHLASGKVYVEVAEDSSVPSRLKAEFAQFLEHHDHPCKPLQALYDQTPTLAAFSFASIACWSLAHAQMVRDRLITEYLQDGTLLNVLTQLA